MNEGKRFKKGAILHYPYPQISITKLSRCWQINVDVESRSEAEKIAKILNGDIIGQVEKPLWRAWGHSTSFKEVQRLVGRVVK